MDEQITQLDRRLTSVEVEVASLAAEALATRGQSVTKEDMAKLDGRVAVIQSNYATKEDMAQLEARVAVIQSNYVTKEDLAAVDSKLCEKIAALRLDISELENRMVRWSFATILTVSGVVVAVVKIWP
ncbi:hypothetical protein RugamoR64_53120 [Duganella rhizosphaerae]|uniref:hypothetical protein n=1 Tax=Duganella rhizosphaerae TaxID=2885763 RepID=UPI000A7AD077